MRVVISQKIKKKEFKKGMTQRELRIILDSFGKKIFDPIKASNLPKGSKLIKIYATTVAGARRIIFLVNISSGDGFFLFYRSKNDKIGKNITVKNAEF